MSTPLELSYQEFGQGKPLIILHGLFGSSTNWRGIARTLSDSFKVYVLDARNHGESPWSDAMTYDAMANDLGHFIKQHELKKPGVIGHSMGGKTAMAAALRFPELTDRLAILDIAPVVYSHTHAPHIDAMQNIDLASLKSRTDADAALKRSIPQAAIRQFLLQNLVYKDGMYSWRINLEVSLRAMDDLIGFPELQNIPVYTHDTLFLYGGLSDYVQPASHRRILELFPNTKFETVENAGHWLHAEQPKLVSEILGEFLK